MNSYSATATLPKRKGLLLAGTVLGAAVLLTLAGLRWKSAAQAGVSPSGADSPASSAVLAPTDVVSEGIVEPGQFASLSISQPGVVEEVLVKEGQAVEKGQLLLRLESKELQARVQSALATVTQMRAQLDNVRAGARPQELKIRQASVDQAKANLDQAQAEWDRMKRLSSAQVISPQQHDQAQSQYLQAQGAHQEALAALELAKAGARPQAVKVSEADVAVAQATLEQAEALLAKTELRAPFAGTIAYLDVHSGEFISPEAPVVRLADLSHWQIRTDDLTELSIRKVKVGAKARIRFDAYPGLELRAKVQRIRDYGEKKRGDMTYTVLLDLEQTDPRLRWNLTATVRIDPTE